MKPGHTFLNPLGKVGKNGVKSTAPEHVQRRQTCNTLLIPRGPSKVASTSSTGRLGGWRKQSPPVIDKQMIQEGTPHFTTHMEPPNHSVVLQESRLPVCSILRFHVQVLYMELHTGFTQYGAFFRPSKYGILTYTVI